ncbi:hypothetical protein GNI_159900, partial [Gregarina niphandrodes]
SKSSKSQSSAVSEILVNARAQLKERKKAVPASEPGASPASRYKSAKELRRVWESRAGHSNRKAPIAGGAGPGAAPVSVALPLPIGPQKESGSLRLPHLTASNLHANINNLHAPNNNLHAPPSIHSSSVHSSSVHTPSLHAPSVTSNLTGASPATVSPNLTAVPNLTADSPLVSPFGSPFLRSPLARSSTAGSPCNAPPAGLPPRGQSAFRLSTSFTLDEKLFRRLQTPTAAGAAGQHSTTASGQAGTGQPGSGPPGTGQEPINYHTRSAEAKSSGNRPPEAETEA